ncbi:MAG TPA: GspH/FimT family pseudopilin [Thauera phenylacetica]|nr:GspH/FimT family pseudopilin [Thauera phenylacetica]
MTSKSSSAGARWRAFGHGFSLVELMVTVAVLSLLMVLAVPSFTEWIQNSRIRTAAESVQNGVQLARAEAVRRNARVEFALVGTSGGWVVRFAGGGATIQARSGSEGAGGVVLSTVPEDATSVAFDGLGRSDNTLTAINVDVPTSALPAAQSRDLRITIGTGGVRMCDPNVSDSRDPRKC